MVFLLEVITLLVVGVGYKRTQKSSEDICQMALHPSSYTHCHQFEIGQHLACMLFLIILVYTQRGCVCMIEAYDCSQISSYHLQLAGLTQRRASNEVEYLCYQKQVT